MCSWVLLVFKWGMIVLLARSSGSWTIALPTSPSKFLSPAQSPLVDNKTHLAATLPPQLSSPEITSSTGISAVALTPFSTKNPSVNRATNRVPKKTSPKRPTKPPPPRRWKSPSPDCKATGCVSVGLDHTCVVKKSGFLKCWGGNDSGQCNVPTGFKSNIAWVSAGSTHSCAVSRLAALACWGSNSFGEASVPADFRVGIASVSCGDGHTCAVNLSGRLKCWGRNNVAMAFYAAGQRRRFNFRGIRNVPAKFSSNVASVTVSSFGGCAITRDGQAGCWGKMLDPGVMKYTRVNSPPAAFATNVVSISMGRGTLDNVACVVNKTGNLGCWIIEQFCCQPQRRRGRRLPPVSFGRDICRGKSCPRNIRELVVPINSRTGIRQVYADVERVCVVTVENRLHCFDPVNGDNIRINRYFTDVAMYSNSASLYPINDRWYKREDTECVVESGGPLVCWGANSDGQATVDGDYENLGTTCDRYCASTVCAQDFTCNGPCVEGYYKSNGRCRPCPDGCLACSAATKCSECSYGYALVNGQCASNCNVDGCWECEEKKSDSCSACLPGYSLNYDNGLCVPDDWCPDGQYPFQCNGPGCTKRDKLTNGRRSGCITQLDCQLLYAKCLREYGFDGSLSSIECQDCCIRVATAENKVWYLMRFKDNTLINCDPQSRRCCVIHGKCRRCAGKKCSECTAACNCPRT